ncbi:MAG: MFS transporter [Bacteroidales bacterium]|nr:MFS transporter [Bacteroidales bacterium]
MSNWKRTFITIWTGQLISTLSSAIVGFAVIFWLSIETGSAEVLAFATIAALLPQMVLGLFTGVFIDRWSRKKTMILADVFIALCTLGIAVMFYTGDARVTYVYILLAFRSAGAAFHIPAMQASVPLLAPEDQLMRIAGINNIIQSVSNIAGPAIAAILINLLDMTWVLLIDVVGAIIACVSLLMVHIPNPIKKDAVQPNMLREIMEGLKEIYKKPGLLWMFILSVLATFFIMPIAVLFPLMTLHHFSGNAYHMSVIEIAWGIGMLLGGAIMGISRLRSYKIILINLMYFILGMTFVFSGILPASGFIFFAAITIFGGISMAIYSGAFTVVLQTLVEPSALGRVFSMYGSITLLPSMIGLLATGFIADSIGITNAFIISGIAIALLGLGAFLVPPLKVMVREEVRSRE